MYFDENAFTKLDCKNLLYCQFLNLRSSLFKELEIKYLLSLQYIDIALSQIKELDLRSVTGLRKVIVDELQTVQVNDGVVVCVLGKDDLLDEKVVEAVEEEIYLPLKAPDGTEDTQMYHGLENVSIGETDYDCTQNILLKNG